jgi:GTP-binding protein HflX
VIITDTVGFIRNLPPELMDAFRTTFEEIAPADVLVHVLDASSAQIEEHHDVVRRVLAELGFDDKPVITVLNKVDCCAGDVAEGLAQRYGAIPLSALDRGTFAPLLKAIHSMIWDATRAASTGADDARKRNVV